MSLSKGQTRQSNAYNTQHHDYSKLKVGDLVLLDRNGIELSATQNISKKLLNPWIGPFEIIAFDDEKDNATLRLPFSMKVHDVFHIRCLRRYIPPNTDFPTRFTPSSSESIVKDDGEEWDVEKILGTRVRRKKRQFWFDGLIITRLKTLGNRWKIWRIAVKVCWNLLKRVLKRRIY